MRALEEGRIEGLQVEKEKERKEEGREEVLGDGEVEAPPERSQGVWGDVMWFGRLVARTVRS